MYIITGASGNTGKRIAQQLLDAGKSVTVVGRTIEHLTPFVEQGATAAVGNLEDTDFLVETLKGATAVYAMVPPNFATNEFTAYQKRVANALTTAIRVNQVPYAVALSSFGAHLTNAGVVTGMHYLEEQLNQVESLAAVYLRAGFFYQNFYGSIGLLQDAGILAGFPIEGDKPLALVHTDDIADAATRHLLSLDFTGKSVQFVAGPRNLTLQEVARIIGKAIGKPDLQWVNFGYEQARSGMLGAGFTTSLADNYVEFCKRVNDGNVMNGFERNAESTTLFTLEEFARTEFAPAYLAAVQETARVEA